MTAFFAHAKLYAQFDDEIQFEFTFNFSTFKMK